MGVEDIKNLSLDEKRKLLARLLEEKRNVENNKIELSYGQKALWFMYKLDPDSGAYNVSFAANVSSGLQVESLKRTFEELIKRHDSLRTTFYMEDGEVYQKIHESIDLPFKEVDASKWDEEALKETVSKEAYSPFDIEKGPVIKMVLYKKQNSEYVFLVSAHHIIIDLWSMGILLNELQEIYKSLRRGKSLKLTEIKYRYKDYIKWQKKMMESSDGERLWRYWKEKLSGELPILNLPIDKERPAIQTFRGTAYSDKFDSYLSEKIRMLAKRYKTTVYTVLVAAYNVLLYRYTNQEDILVGTTAAGRNKAEFESVVGYFVNPVVLRSKIIGDNSFEDFLGQVRQTVLEAIEHQDYPFSRLVEQIQPERSHRHSPIFQVAFSLERLSRPEQEGAALFAMGQSSASLSIDDFTMSSIDVEQKYVQYDLMLMIADLGSNINASWQYSSDLFEEDTIKRMSQNFKTLLASILENPSGKVSSFAIISDDEFKRLHDFNKKREDIKEYNHPSLVFNLFEEQVRKYPDKEAIKMKDKSLSYKELDNRSNQLANYLLDKGVKPEKLVGVFMERSIESIVSIIGIIKAGGAYLPLDPSYPKERLKYMIENSNVEIIITKEEFLENLYFDSSRCICVDREGHLLDGQFCTPPEITVKPDNMAYVIYTSGSTGTPKGVIVEHKGICNLVKEQIKVFGLKPDSRVLQFASLSFDASVSEIFTTLCAGATLIMVPKEEMMPGVDLENTINKYEITEITLPPSALAIMKPENLPTLRTVVAAGEASTLDIINNWAKEKRFINAYGPTENTVCATMGECFCNDERVTIGKPINGANVYILDKNLQPVPIGVIGELCISGIGIARGYLGLPEMTNEKFVKNPIETDTFTRLYRTGDLARYLSDGRIEFIGRLDHQVKVRGFRVELGEIQKAINEEVGVKESIILPVKDANGNIKLSAYIVRQEENESDSDVELWPSVAEYFVYDDLLYYAMTNDKKRNESYMVAMNKLVKGKKVVEIGTGKDAILARLCIEAGAEKVYAIELLENTYNLAKECIERHGLTDKIELIHGNAMEVQLPEKVDVCVSEIVGAIGGTEGSAVLLNDAWRFLKEDGVMIPERSVTMIAPISLPENLRNNIGFSPTGAYYVNKIFEQVGYKFDLRVCIKNFPKSNLVSKAQVFELLDHTGFASPEFKNPVRFEIEKDGRIDGFLVWLTLETIKGEVIDILENSHCWIPVYFPVFHGGIQVSKGDVIEGFCIGTLCENKLNPDYKIEGVLRRKNAEDIEFSYDSYHFKNSYERTEFYKEIFSNDEIKVSYKTTEKEFIQGIKEKIKNKLTHYMIPSNFIILDNVPVTNNGKVDKKKLEEIYKLNNSTKKEIDHKYTNPIQEMLISIWGKVLDVSTIDIHDNFFELGGHSLLATQIVANIRNLLSVNLTIQDLMKNPTIYQLSKIIETEKGKGKNEEIPPIEHVEGLDYYPLTFAQQRLWFLDQMEKGNSAYNIPGALRLNGRLNISILKKSIEEIIKRHDILRASFILKDGVPVQVISKEVSLNFEVINIEELNRVKKEEIIKSYVEKEANSSFSLSEGGLVRVKLLKLSEEEHILLLTIHHIVTDGWSMGILVRELVELYKANYRGEYAKLPVINLQYTDYALWQSKYLQGEYMEKQLQYWIKQLDGSPTTISLETDYPRPEVQTFKGEIISYNLPKELSEKILNVSKDQEATLYMTLLSAFSIILSRYSGQDDILIGSPVAGRNSSEMFNNIGMFINTVVMRTDLSGDPTFKELISRIREVAVNAYAHQDVPFEKIVEALQPERSLKHTPLFQVMFNMLNLERVKINLPDLDVEVMPQSEHGSKFDITLYAEEKDEGIYLELVYNADLFNRKRMEKFICQYEFLLNQIVDNVNSNISQYSLVFDDDKKLLPCPKEVNTAKSEESIYEIFTQRAINNKQKIAISDCYGVWSYETLELLSNKVAVLLNEKNIREKDVVAVYTERCGAISCALLGIMKAGAAFMMMDSEYPSSRLIEQIEQVKPKAFIHIKNGLPLPSEIEEALNKVECHVKINMPNSPDSNKWEELANYNVEHSWHKWSPDDLAYIAFTSGSTGKPQGIKGTMLPLSHFINWHIKQFNFDESYNFAMLSGISHDPLLRDIFTPLCSGGTLYVPSKEVIMNPENLAYWLKDNDVSSVHITPAMAQLITSNADDDLKLYNLKYVFFGGDILTVKDVLRIKKIAPLSTCVNFYGATETPQVMGYEIIAENLEETSAENIKIPIGKGIDGAQLLVMNNSNHIAGVGEIGEIYVRTQYLSKGYLNNKELSEERFVVNPFTDNKDDLLYKTGDMGYYLSDGRVQIIGRKDRQIKIRGFRVEPREIETAILSCADIKDALVTIYEDETGDKRFAAYLVQKDMVSIDTEKLKNDLKAKLPSYMVPTFYITLNNIPLTPNKKIDYKKLPKPDIQHMSLGDAYQEPDNETEKIIAQVWREVLNVDKIGRIDNFFDLGGHSLLLAKVYSKLKEYFDKEFSIVDMFKYPNISTLASFLDSKQEDTLNLERIKSRVDKNKEALIRRRLMKRGENSGTKSDGNDE